MIYSTGCVNILRDECGGTILGLSASPNGLNVVVIQRTKLKLWRCNLQSWCCVASIENKRATELGKNATCQISWKQDLTTFVVVYSQLYLADFYRIQETSGPRGVEIQTPKWSSDGDVLGTDRAYKLNLVYTVESTITGENIDITAITSNRYKLVVGTRYSTIVPLLWSGEVVVEKEIDLSGKNSELTAINELSIDSNKFLAFLTGSGRCGIYNFTNSQVHIVKDQNAACISLDGARKLLIVGHDSSENGNVSIYSYSSAGFVLVRYFNLTSFGISVKNIAASRIRLYADRNYSCFGVCYDGLGVVVWTTHGCKLLSTMPEIEPSRGERSLKVDLAWACFGFQLIACTPYIGPSTSNERTRTEQSLWNLDMLKRASLSSSTEATDSICLIGSSYLKFLRSQDWDIHSLSWEMLHIPKSYIHFNWPIRIVTICKDKNQVAIAGKRGAALYNFSTHKWRLFGNINTEQSIICIGLYWCGAEAICILNKNPANDRFDLLFYPRDHLDDSSLMSSASLHSRPLQLDIDFKSRCVIIMFKDELCVYYMKYNNEAVDNPVNLEHQSKMHFDLVKQNTVKLPDGIRELGLPRMLFILPCGHTRRTGTIVRFPKCFCTTLHGNLYILDTENGNYSHISKNVERVLITTWNSLEKTKHSNPWLLSTKISVNLPSTVLFAVWICDINGLRLWLPALDFRGEMLEHSLTPFDNHVAPIGVIESHGILVGITQRSGIFALIGDCFQVGIRIQPCIHGLLQWLLFSERYELASDVLVLASQRLSLFQESLELLIFQAVKNDQKRDKSAKLLPKVLKLLRTGKATTIIPQQCFSSILVSCARKIESSWWNYLFDMVGSPEQYFNECVYYGQLRTASYFLVIADHYSPEKAASRLEVLKSSAENAGDISLLKEIEHYKTLRERTLV